MQRQYFLKEQKANVTPGCKNNILPHMKQSVTQTTAFEMKKKQKTKEIVDSI